MRTVIIDGRSFEVRGLKRKQVKQLKRDGFNLTDLKPETADDAMDAVFAATFGDADLSAIDEMRNGDALRLWTAILKETFGAPDEEKNS